MIIWDEVLIVDDSTVYRQLMETLLAPYAGSVLTAESASQAIERIDAHPDIELILCDYVMADDDGLAVLEHLAAMPEPKPRVLMVTGHPSEAVAQRSRELGAVGYLEKPTSVRKIIRALRRTARNERRLVNPRWRCPGRAHLLDDGDGHVIWDVYNISETGAFLETKGPIPVGSELELRLEIRGRKAEVTARVVRIQEPSWMDVGGVGVEFVAIDAEAEEAIRGAIETAEVEG